MKNMNHDFLPVCREDMEKRGWKSVDFAYIIGKRECIDCVRDAARLLENELG